MRCLELYRLNSMDKECLSYDLPFATIELYMMQPKARSNKALFLVMTHP